MLAALVNSLPQNVIIQNFTCDSVFNCPEQVQDINSTKYLRNLKIASFRCTLDKVIYRSNNEPLSTELHFNQIVEMENLMPYK